MPKSTDVKNINKELRAQVKALKATIKEQKANTKLLEKNHKASIAAAIEEAYNQGHSDGFEDCIGQQIKLEDAFDVYMDKAAKAFEKEYTKKSQAAAKKAKGSSKKKTATKKASTTKKTTATKKTATAKKPSAAKKTKKKAKAAKN